jgi:uncharacterized protein YkvS
MTKTKFEIGETEKNTIIVNVTPLLKYTAIEVDGEKSLMNHTFYHCQKSSML